MADEKTEKQASDEWEQIEGSDFYVSRAAMESIPKKPDEPEAGEKPPDTWNKVCPEPTTDEYGQDKWRVQPRNDVPTVECGFSAVAMEQEFEK